MKFETSDGEDIPPGARAALTFLIIVPPRVRCMLQPNAAGICSSSVERETMMPAAYRHGLPVASARVGQGTIRKPGENHG